VCVCVSLTCNCDLIFILTLGTAQSYPLILSFITAGSFFFYIKFALLFVSYKHIKRLIVVHSVFLFFLLYVNPDFFFRRFLLLNCLGFHLFSKREHETNKKNFKNDFIFFSFICFFLEKFNFLFFNILF